MNSKNWMIYGAYGYTGGLVAEQAVKRGHKPVLAGRSAGKLASLAERLGLEYIVVDLDDEARLSHSLQDVDLVFHTAGPFMHTIAPMVRACLQTSTHYMDVSGEVAACEQILSRDQQARQKGIALIPGAGFDVIATDCLARYVAERVAHPDKLEIATFTSITTDPSPGTAKTFIDSLPGGILTREQGHLVRISLRGGMRRIHFIDRERVALPVSLGDLATAYRTTGIPNITTYAALSEKSAKSLIRAEPILRKLYAFAPLRRLAQKQVEKTARGPDEHLRQAGRSQVWVSVHNEAGVEKQAWLEAPEAYRFTAEAGVRCVERLLAERLQGALTPAVAFGADFVLQIPETRRVDRLEDA